MYQTNLKSFSIDKTREDGITKIKIGAKSEAHKHTFSVADIGEGIELQYHKKIFEKK